MQNHCPDAMPVRDLARQTHRQTTVIRLLWPVAQLLSGDVFVKYPLVLITQLRYRCVFVIEFHAQIRYKSVFCHILPCTNGLLLKLYGNCDPIICI